MARSAVATEIERLAQVSRATKGGGLALVQAIGAFRRSLSEEDAKELREVLLEAVTVEDPALCGVALQVLEEEGDQSLPAFLMARLEADPLPSVDLADDIVLALCRMGRLPASHQRLIEAALAAGPQRGLVGAAALIRSDPEASLRMMSDFLGRHFLAWSDFERDSYLAPIVIYYSAADPNHLITLVQEVGLRSREAAALLAHALDRQIHLPFRADLMDSKTRQAIGIALGEWKR